jgi:hypothetical protein
MGVEEVKFTDHERELVAALSDAAGGKAVAEYEMIKAVARKVAREEIASLAGLVLTRTQERNPTRLSEHNIAEDVVMETLASIFGEALSDFGGHTKGSEPGS